MPPSTAASLDTLVQDLTEEIHMELRVQAQREQFSIYLTGLLSDAERKSLEPPGKSGTGKSHLLL